MDRRGRIFLLLVSLLLADPSECMDGYFMDRKKFANERKVESFILSRAYSQYQDCVDDLYASDLDTDLKLREGEYVEFIATRSRGAIDVGAYVDLPFSLISTFVYGSCFCSFLSKTPFCCIGNDAGIGLDPDESPHIEDNLITICRTVNDSIRNEVGTLEPTQSPTALPSGSPTTKPSGAPTDAPSLSPTTRAPTVSPTVEASQAPSSQPSPQPSPQPSAFVETPQPTPLDLACVNFQYGIENTDGFSSEELENEVGNTYKSGLITATRTVTILALNATLPRDRKKRDPEKRTLGTAAEAPGRSGFTLTDLGRFREDWADSNDPDTQSTRRTAYLPEPQSEREANRRRKLAYYTDDYPPVIRNIFDSAYCPTEGVVCSVVDASVCVILEEGDKEKQVRESLIFGIEQAFRAGRFEDAIPAEDRLSGN